MKNYLKSIFIVTAILTLISCKDSQEYSKIKKQEAPKTKELHEVVLKEYMNAAGYSYMNVSEDEKTYWMAIPESNLKVGNTYYYAGGMQMKNFESKELKRTFESIVFVEGVSETKITSNGKMKDPHDHSGHTNTKVEKINIEQPKGGSSVAELFSKKDNYKGKEVTVKGKVVKVNNGILERNWVHLADGTSFEKHRSVTVTTTEEVKVGDVLTFKGTVALDKDFGYGYVYGLLVEKGTLVK